MELWDFRCEEGRAEENYVYRKWEEASSHFALWCLSEEGRGFGQVRPGGGPKEGPGATSTPTPYMFFAS